ncbi:hypothetical protein SAMN04489751_1003 [Brevibacterium sandarakinum]|uniref:Transcriptional regulator, AbiEi antitoxin, Type IV TA system n=2 Tax=Brevibacterium sandarakinum TaxID=629680 RepID=A0A1H1NNG1_BRESA|nr:hypothetical protein SAMN04489751_1003 [Brevibacterium sandarakinum]
MFKYSEHMSKSEHSAYRTPEFVERAISHLGELGAHAEWKSRSEEYGHAVSGTLLIGADGKRHEFQALASATVTKADVAMLPHDRKTVLITEQVVPTRARQLEDHGWGGYVDAAGNASLRADGLIIEITGKRSPDKAPVVTAAPFTRAGIPVTYSLLTANDHFGVTPSQRALAASSGASLGTVNRVVRALRERTPPMLQGKHNQLLRASALEREWISAYTAMQPSIWPEERFTSTVWRTPSELLEAPLPPNALLGSEAAAARLGAPIRPASVLIHFDGDARARRELIQQGRLRRADDGMIRLRPACWKVPPVPPFNQKAPRLLVRADLLLEDDPRIDEIRSEYFEDM